MFVQRFYLNSSNGICLMYCRRIAQRIYKFAYTYINVEHLYLLYLYLLIYIYYCLENLKTNSQLCNFRCAAAILKEGNEGRMVSMNTPRAASRKIINKRGKWIFSLKFTL